MKEKRKVNNNSSTKMRTYYNDNHYQLYLRIDERKEKKKSKTKVNQNTKM